MKPIPVDEVSPFVIDNVLGVAVDAIRANFNAYDTTVAILEALLSNEGPPAHLVLASALNHEELPKHHIRVDGPSPKGQYVVREILNKSEIQRCFFDFKGTAMHIAEQWSKEYVAPIVDKTKG